MKELSYWDQHYGEGGISGEGSIGDYRNWKWQIIKKYTDNSENLGSVIDVGCGDISFWQGKTCQDYLGIDISKTIVEKNQAKRPEWTFVCDSADVHKDIKADYVFCFDILFHIMDDNMYEKILKNIISYSRNMIFIYTWIRNPLNDRMVKRTIRYNLLKKLKLLLFLKSYLVDLTTDHYYQTYRDFNKYYHLFESGGFDLVATEPIPIDDFGAMYIFKKKE